MEYPKFKVCCRCFTFNHSKYITDAMNGFTMQQTSFPFVCTIVDDASTDGEQEVIRKYVEENFDFSEGSVAYHKETDYAHITYAQHKTNKNCYFAILYLKENHYSKNKPKMGYLSEWQDMCEYEALCEGDDYWIVPDKLEKQVGYMDAHPNCGLTYSSFNTKDEAVGIIKENLPQKNPTKYPMVYSSLEDFIISKGYVCPPSWVYRRKIWNTFIPIPGAQDGTFCMFCHFYATSEVYWFKEVFAVYRLLKESACHSQNPDKMHKRDRNILDTQIKLIEKYNLREELKQKCIISYYHMALPFFIAHDYHKDINDAKSYLVKLTTRDKILILGGHFLLSKIIIKILYKIKKQFY